MKITRKRIPLNVPFIPMADIAFNLVLFFIMMAKTQDDSSITWRPAKGDNLKPAGNSRISIVVDDQNRLFFNGEQVSESEIKDRVSRELGDDAPGNRLVLLKIDRDTQALRFEPIIEAVSQAGGEIVHVLDGTP